jgi:hypothetical protein
MLSRCTTLLVIGFSGLDRHVLELLAKHRFKYMRFVNGRAEDGYQAARRYMQAAKISVIPEDITHSGGFGGFVNSGELADFVKV